MNDTPPSTTFNQEVGANLRMLRAEFKLSQTDLADAMTKRGHGWQQQTVLKIEKGSRPLRFDEAEALSQVFGVSLAAIRAAGSVATEFALRRATAALRELKVRRNQIDDEISLAHERIQELETMQKEGEHDGDR